jgi:UDP-N-acetylglucosamine 2-epimerase
MLLITYGTRPEYIKVLPIINEMKKNGLPFKIIFTGQHKDLTPKNSDYILTDLYSEGNRLDNIVKNCLSIPDEYFKDITSILVQGDTTSVVGLSIAALHRKIKVIHLEAGLRTYDYENPYPEENNRRIVSSIATIHLCPTKNNAKNLKNEKVIGDIYVVGNTILDNLIEYKNICEYTNKVLVTLHRRENHNEIDKWFNEINSLAIENKDLEFILPIHPNPNVQKHRKILTNVNVIEPLSHEELLKILVKTKLVITDSGGIQEECSFFNKKCLVCRKITERPESIGLSSFIVGDHKNLKDIFYFHLKNTNINITSPYGNGKSAKKIIKIFKKIKI